jgi:hypothetical protein
LYSLFYVFLSLFQKNLLSLQHKNDEAMDEKTKELLAKARQLKKQLKEGSFPIEEVLEEKAFFGMHDNFQAVRSMIENMPKPKTGPKKKPSNENDKMTK